MKIVIIGAGAMGAIYGGHLSTHNEVYIVDNDKSVVEVIKQKGIKIEEEGNHNYYYPTALSDTKEIGVVDLVILFVKSIFSTAALETNRNLIGPNTRLMTLQNGAGHEELLMKFAPKEHIIIGTTEDNGTVVELGHVRRGGSGVTNIGMLVRDNNQYLEKVKEAFDCCGFYVNIHNNIQELIWRKLFTNVSLSVVTAILQVDMGFIVHNEFAWRLTQDLVREAIRVAAAVGLVFNEEDVVEEVRLTSINNPFGCTSIRADVRDGRKTEVDNISGAVVRAAKKHGVNVPLHEFVVNIIHSMEGKKEKFYGNKSR